VPTADRAAAEQLGRRFFGSTRNAAPSEQAH